LLEALEDAELFSLPVVLICATLELDEPPPHAAASMDSPTMPPSASGRSAARFGCDIPLFDVRVPRAKIGISSPSLLGLSL
jgi:hypothetical protein